MKMNSHDAHTVRRSIAIGTLKPRIYSAAFESRRSSTRRGSSARTQTTDAYQSLSPSRRCIRISSKFRSKRSSHLTSARMDACICGRCSAPPHTRVKIWSNKLIGVTGRAFGPARVAPEHWHATNTFLKKTRPHRPIQHVQETPEASAK